MVFASAGPPSTTSTRTDRLESLAAGAATLNRTRTGAYTRLAAMRAAYGRKGVPGNGTVTTEIFESGSGLNE